MAVEITMPQLSDTMHEGRILRWLKNEGETITRGDALAEVATDKADLEIESFHEGTLLKIHAQVGTTVKVGSIIAEIGGAGEQVAQSNRGAPAAVASPAPTPAAASAAPAPQAQPAPTPPPTQQYTATNGHSEPRGSGGEDRLKISPLARNAASRFGVDVSRLQGSGEGGRIVKRDIEVALGREIPSTESEELESPVQMLATPPAPATAPRVQAMTPPPAPTPLQTQQPAISLTKVLPGTPAESGAYRSEPLSRMRETIAQRMVESATSIPHFYVTTKINAGPLAKLKVSLKPLPQYEGLTYNHLIIKAVALALKVVPRINGSYRDGNVIQPQEINIGIITAVTDGLLIPIVRNADQLSVSDLTAEARALVQRARSGRPKSSDLMGGTFCISNMGMFAVENFTAIINPGQGGILAVSAIEAEPIVVDGKVEPGTVMRVTLSVDHRIIDGVVAGEFLTELKRLLEDPVLLFV